MNDTEFEGRGFLFSGGLTRAVQAVGLLAANKGATVAFGVQEHERDTVAHLLRGAAGQGLQDRIYCVQARYSSESDVEHLFDRALELLPQLDVVVHDAGTEDSDRGGRLLDLNLAAWNESLGRYLRSPFLVARRAVTEFLAEGTNGRIVFLMASRRDDWPADREAGLSACYTLMRSVAKEYGRRGITSNALAAGADGNSAEWISHDLGREIAEAALFLASEDSSYITGTMFELGKNRAAGEPAWP